MYVKYLKFIFGGFAWTRDPNIEKKKISPILPNIAQFYFYRVDREKLYKIDTLIIKIGYKMADLSQLKKLKNKRPIGLNSYKHFCHFKS